MLQPLIVLAAMRLRLFYCFPFLCLVLCSLLLSGCGKVTPEILKRDDLFSLRLGKMEDGVDLFQVNGIKSPRKNRIFMRSGIFYLANGNANKIMEFSSYGDLLQLLYNPRDNGKPVLMGSETGQGRISNKVAIPYNFQELGEIAVARSGILLAEDHTADTSSQADAQLGVVLNTVILRFNSAGHYLDYLGQEGIGGSPFPYIEGLYLTVSDEIVVVCRTTNQWLIYWYNIQGQRKYHASIPLDQLPIPGDVKVNPSLKTIRPDPEFPQLYLQIDYYPISADSRSDTVSSRIYTFNLASGRYESYFTLPVEEQKLTGASKFEPSSIQSLHEFLGVSIGGHFFFINRSGEGLHKLTIMDRNGRVLYMRTLLMEDSQVVDESLNLSFEGVISAFLGFPDRASVVWWRADSLLGTPFSKP